jgi:hypothetical protein
MTQIVDLGKLRFYWADSWNSATEYELNDVVKYGGNAYVYTNALATTGNLPTNTTYWKTMVEGINFLGVYSSGTAYKPGDSVTHGANLYLAENPTTGNTPPNATYWSLLASGIQYEGTFSSVETYQKNDIVTFGGSVYIALQDTVGTNAPSSSANTAYWAKFVDGTYPSQSGNANKILKTDGTSVSWTDAISIASGTVSADLTVGDQAFVGPGAATFAGSTDADLTNPALVVRFDNGETEDSYAQIAFQNDDPTSSTDIIAYMDNGTDTSGWVGMGIAGSSFNDATYGITAPGDGYIFSNTKAGNGRNGNFVIATGDQGDQNKLVFAAGGFASGDTQMTITPESTGVDANVHIETPTASVSPTTGALTVVGGVGISGDVNIQGDMSIVGNFTFGGGSTSAENLSVTNPLVFVGDGNNADTQDLGLVGEYSAPVTISTATVNNKALTDNVATLTTAAAHNFLVGDRITVAGVDATFNGTYALTAVTSTTFSYAKTNANITSAAVSPTGTADAVTRREFAGAVRDASDGVFKFFQDAITKPSSTVNFAEAGLTYADIQVDDITADQITGTGNLTIATDKLTVNASTGAVGMSGALTTTGLITANGGITSSSALTFTGGATFSGTVDVQELRETVVDVTLSSNSGTLDWTAGNIYYIATAPTGNMTLNATNVPTDVSKIMTLNVMVTQGSTGYIPTIFQIGGSSQTIRWVGGSAPTPTSSAGKIDIFSFTMQRTSGGAWIVYGSASLNF